MTECLLKLSCSKLSLTPIERRLKMCIVVRRNPSQSYGLASPAICDHSITCHLT